MKHLLLFSAVCLLSTAYAQISPQRTDNPSGNRGGHQPNPFPGKTGAEVSAEDRSVQLYNGWIVSADRFFTHEQFVEAVITYKKALAVRDEQYPKDQIMRAEAAMENERKQRAQQEQDAALRYDAKRASYEKNSTDSVFNSLFATSNGAFGEHVVHFTGALMSDHYSVWGMSRIYDFKDTRSNFLKPGRYDSLTVCLSATNDQTWDGIAVPSGTRLIVYKNASFSGEVLLDVTGPAVINNRLWNDSPIDGYSTVNSDTYQSVELQYTFPQSVRRWSETNMHEWVYGSLEIIAL